VLEQWYNGAVIKPGTKTQMGSTVDMVLGDGVGNRQFVVPSLIGMTYAEAKSLLQANGLAFGAVIAPGIDDTLHAYIYKQSPERFDDERKFRYIRSGQLMDIWLQAEKPIIDSVIVADPALTEQ